MPAALAEWVQWTVDWTVLTKAEKCVYQFKSIDYTVLAGGRYCLSAKRKMTVKVFETVTTVVVLLALTSPLTVHAGPPKGRAIKHLKLPKWGAAPKCNDGHPQRAKLIFSDEFDGDTLNRDKWCTRLPYGKADSQPDLQVEDTACRGPLGWEGSLNHLWTTQEQERYVDFNSAGVALHELSGGVLHLLANPAAVGSPIYEGAVPDPAEPLSYLYEAAMIRSKRELAPSKGETLYIVAQVKLPSVKGTWPAFWMVPGWGDDEHLETPPEIDIFEGPLNENGENADMIRISALVSNGQTNSPTNDRVITYSSSTYDREWAHYEPANKRSLRDRWLVIAAEWKQGSVCFYVDGQKVVCENYEWVYDRDPEAPPSTPLLPANPAVLLLNLAIGGTWAGSNGVAPDSAFPTSYDIDFVRVYSVK